MRLIDRKIVLEDGSEYYGYGFGSYTDRVCEIVFNTSMVGYQEIVSDPSYTDQMVVMTYPLIGNYGITDDDFECKNPSIGGLIVYDYNDMPSNFRYTKTPPLPTMRSAASAAKSAGIRAPRTRSSMSLR